MSEAPLEAPPERPNRPPPAPAAPWKPGLVYHAIRTACRIAAHVVHRVVIEGRENVPLEGGLVIASNHQSHVDVPLISATTPRVVTFVARDTLESSALLAWIMRCCGTLLLRRGSADRKAIQGIVERLREGGCVSIFPEGTRTTDGRLGETKGGVILAARLAGVPIVPLTIRGALDVLPRGVSLPRPRRIWVRYSPPIDPRAPDALERLRGAIEEHLGDGRFPRG